MERSRPTLPVEQPTKSISSSPPTTAKVLGNEAAKIASVVRRRGDRVKRREFITLIGGAARVADGGARATTGADMRRIGVLMSVARGRSGRTAASGSISQGPAGIGLDRRPQRADRPPVGRPAMPSVLVTTRRSWSQLGPDVTSGQWRPPRGGGCSRPPEPCRSCSPWSADPVGAGFVDRAWLTRAATRPDLPCSSTT